MKIMKKLNIAIIALWGAIALENQCFAAESTAPADTAERFDAFREQIRKNVSIQKINELAPKGYEPEPTPLPEAQQIVNEIRDNVMTIFTPFLQEIKIPRSSTDSTLVPYRVVNFKALEKITPDQLKAIASSPAAQNIGKLLPAYGMEGLFRGHPELINKALGDIAAQLVLFDNATRAELSQLLIAWFTLLQKEIPSILGFFKDKTANPDIFYDFEKAVDYIEKVKAKASKDKNIAAAFLAIWYIIAQDLLGGNSAAILFDQLPNSEAIKSAYAKALQSFDIKKMVTKFYEDAPEQGKQMIDKLVNPELVLWAIAGILFLPDNLQKSFIDEPLKAHKKELAEREIRHAIWKKEMEERQIRAQKNTTLIQEIIKQTPGAVEEDLDYLFFPEWYEDVEHRLIQNSDKPALEKKLKERIAERKAWLLKYPDALPSDFGLRLRFENEAELQKYLAGRKAWTAQNPSANAEDYYDTWRELKWQEERRATGIQKSKRAKKQ